MCGPEPAIGRDDEVHFAAVTITPDQQALAAPWELRSDRDRVCERDAAADHGDR